MKSIVKRTLTTLIALPLLFSIIFFIPYYNYIGFVLICIIICILGSYEMREIVDDKHKNLTIQPWVGSLLLVATYIERAFFPKFSLTLFAVVGLLSLGYTIEAFVGAHDGFLESKKRLEIFTLETVYPNLFGTFLIRFAFLPNAWVWIITFLAFVFSSDTAAYIFGMWLGKNNRGIIKVSPNKSIMGFVFGLIIPSIIGFTLTYCFSIYDLNPIQGLVLGFMTALAGICGDLIESVFKRSAHIKDSGVAIPGRGGMLDSVDSIIIAAPVYLLLIFIFSL